jgi:hypothetical protein
MARRAPPSNFILPTATTVIFFFPWHTQPPGPAGRCHDVDFYICEYFGQVLVTVTVGESAFRTSRVFSCFYHYRPAPYIGDRGTATPFHEVMPTTLVDWTRLYRDYYGHGGPKSTASRILENLVLPNPERKLLWKYRGPCNDRTLLESRCWTDRLYPDRFFGPTRR